MWNHLGGAGDELTLQKAVTSGRRAAAIPCSSICEQSWRETKKQWMWLLAKQTCIQNTLHCIHFALKSVLLFTSCIFTQHLYVCNKFFYVRSSSFTEEVPLILSVFVYTVDSSDILLCAGSPVGCSSSFGQCSQTAGHPAQLGSVGRADWAPGSNKSGQPDPSTPAIQLALTGQRRW